MRIVIAGAGPAGLYAAIALRRARPDAAIQIHERNTADATFGFGVVFSDQALAFLASEDADTVALIEPAMQRWSDIEVVHRGERVTIDGVGFSAIGRLQLLRLLQRRAAELGVRMTFGSALARVDDAGVADLVIGADGVNSMVRGETPEAFGEHLQPLANHFAWYGAEREFDRLTQTFRDTPHGPFTAHHYRYAPGRSTFIVECQADTFRRAGLDALDAAAARALCADIFAADLDGAALVGNHSAWRRFPQLACRHWWHGNRVLVGDAVHTAHVSIGSGTRLAMEDVLALVSALRQRDFDIARALPLYEQSRRPQVGRLVEAARASAGWYESFDKHMRLDPWPFARAYAQRSGRVDAARLALMAPRFHAGLRARGLAA